MWKKIKTIGILPTKRNTTLTVIITIILFSMLLEPKLVEVSGHTNDYEKKDYTTLINFILLLIFLLVLIVVIIVYYMKLNKGDFYPL